MSGRVRANERVKPTPDRIRHIGSVTGGIRVFVIGPAEGMLSCGYQGIGRLCDFSTIVKETMGLLASV